VEWNGFIRLKLQDDPDPRNWNRAVNIAQIVSIMPVHLEADIDPTGPESPTFFRAMVDDQTDATTRGLWGMFEVIDSNGKAYWSPVGNGKVNQLLRKLYSESIGDSPT
jgi:hypothetical protein